MQKFQNFILSCIWCTPITPNSLATVASALSTQCHTNCTYINTHGECSIYSVPLPHAIHNHIIVSAASTHDKYHLYLIIFSATLNFMTKNKFVIILLAFHKMTFKFLNCEIKSTLETLLFPFRN